MLIDQISKEPPLKHLHKISFSFVFRNLLHCLIEALPNIDAKIQIITIITGTEEHHPLL
jgi:hypothetical protein